MDVSTAPLPRMDRADASAVFISRRYVGGKEQQKKSAKGILAHWRNLPLPSGFRSVNCFESTDGENVLTVVQWSGSDSFEEFSKIHTPFPIAGQETGADAGRLRPEAYRLYRSSVSDLGKEPVCIVTPTFDVDGPERQRRAVDALLDGPLGAPFPGLTAMHFHLSTDGTRVLNYAEWTDQESHEEFLRSDLSKTAFETLRGISGVRGIPGKRYLLHERLAAPSE